MKFLFFQSTNPSFFFFALISSHSTLCFFAMDSSQIDVEAPAKLNTLDLLEITFDFLIPNPDALFKYLSLRTLSEVGIMFDSFVSSMIPLV